MASKLLLLQACAFLLFGVRGNPMHLSAAQTCIDLCSSCNGIAYFVNDRCECNIGDNSNEEVECLTRMKREAEVHGLDSMSCDLSNDHRSTRCTLGFNHRFRKNDYEQLAKYFMNDGPTVGSKYFEKDAPITGSIFKAPPYTNKKPSSDCEKSSKIITQPPETMKASTDPVPPKKQTASKPPPQKPKSSSDNLVGASQVITQPKETMPSSEKTKANPESEVPYSSEKTGNDNGQISVIQITPGSNTPLIQITPGSKGPIIGAINPDGLTGSARQTKIPEAPSWGPSILNFLSRQFSPPMLGIPKAIKTVTETPGISDLVSAPGNLINSLMQRWANHYRYGKQKENDDKQPESRESENKVQESEDPSNDSDNNNGPQVSESDPSTNTPESKDEHSSTDSPFNSKESENPIEESQDPKSDSDNNNDPHVGASNPSTNTPQFNYINSNVGSPLIGLLNPTLGSAAPSHISYLPPFQAFQAIPVIHSPVINGLPSYSSYMPHMPSATYILSSSIAIPFIPKFNTAGASPNFYKSATNAGDPSKSIDDKIVGVSRSVSTPNMKQKKICKKSNEVEVSRKSTRDINAYMLLESVES